MQVVYIPKSVESIGEMAFCGCNSLTEVVFAAGSQLRMIGKKAFCECGELTIKLPEGVEVISEGCFCDSGIKEIIIPMNIQNIEKRAFN